MFFKPSAAVVALVALSLLEPALGREPWMERDGRAVSFRFTRRRFGQENPAVIQKISSACPGAVCGSLAGGAITPLLAAQGECTQQDFADKIIDESKQFDAATQAAMLKIAIEYRQAEKNVAPDFSTNPPTARNTVFCQKAPKHAELNCLVQAQDPAGKLAVFFDPATGKSVKAGAQRNTTPLCSNSAAAPTSTDNSGTTATPAPAPAPVPAPSTNKEVATTPDAGTGSAGTGNLGDFGTCTVPQIEFGPGFENRKETSFQPVDKKSFNHGSAQAIGIITQFICDTLSNSCKADQAAKDTCKKAQAAAAAQTPKLGVDADAFNAVFGIKTNFAAVQALDDKGAAVGGATGGAAGNAGGAPTTDAGSSAPSTGTATGSSSTSTNSGSTSSASTGSGSTGSASTGSGSTGAASGSSGSFGNFGTCTVPQIDFGVGFDGRKETSFQPTDKKSYDHSSAQNGDIITQFICDTLVNKCGADQTARASCAKARAAFTAATPAKTGKQADAFNAALGITTNFAAVAVVDNRGQVQA